MNKRSLMKLLKVEGFVMIRRGKHETYQANDGTKIQIPSGSKELNWRLEKMILIQIRKRQGTNHEFKTISQAI